MCEAAHDGNSEADELHLAVLVSARGPAWNVNKPCFTEFIRIRTRTRISEDWHRNKWCPPFLQITGVCDKRADQCVCVVDELRTKVRQPTRKTLISLLILLK